MRYHYTTPVRYNHSSNRQYPAQHAPQSRRASIPFILFIHAKPNRLRVRDTAVAFRFRWFGFCHCERSVAISLA